MSKARRRTSNLSRSARSGAFLLIAGLSAGCLNSTTPDKVPDESGNTTDSSSGSSSSSSSSKPELSGRSGSCLLRLDTDITIDNAPGLLVVALDIVNGSVRHAEFASNGGEGPTVGSQDDGGERLADGQQGSVMVVLAEERFKLVSKPKMLKLKISGDDFEMEGIAVKGKCKWK